jgi:hypothetical protein
MKWLLTIVGIAILIGGLWAGWQGSKGVLTAATFGCCALLSFANLDRISEFKATKFGIEAKTRKVLEQAQHTVSELQSLAIIVAETTLSLVKRNGRLGGYSDEEADNIKASVLTVLKKIGVPDSQSDGVLQDWHKLTEFDYVIFILGHSHVPTGFDDHNIICQEWKALKSFEAVPSPQQIRDFLSKWELLTDEREEQVKDYEFYLCNQRHRRPDVWKDRKSWGHLENLST